MSYKPTDMHIVVGNQRTYDWSTKPPTITKLPEREWRLEVALHHSCDDWIIGSGEDAL